jgi:hypothetical protein
MGADYGNEEYVNFLQGYFKSSTTATLRLFKQPPSDMCNGSVNTFNNCTPTDYSDIVFSVGETGKTATVTIEPDGQSHIQY